MFALFSLFTFLHDFQLLMKQLSSKYLRNVVCGFSLCMFQLKGLQGKNLVKLFKGDRNLKRVYLLTVSFFRDFLSSCFDIVLSVSLKDSIHGKKQATYALAVHKNGVVSKNYVLL